MSTTLDTEFLRLAEQVRLDQLKAPRERNRWGQFATPPALALEIARYAWRRLRRRKGRLSFLDPAIGTGSFYGAFLQAFPHDRIERAAGIELDPAFARAAQNLWSAHGLRVVEGDFTLQSPQPIYDVILTNPPYVRHHHLAVEGKRRLGQLAYSTTGVRLSGLAGLYCYFLLIAHGWLAPKGLGVWLIPSEFMDVNYGEQVKRYLTERVCLVHVHRFCPAEVQFDDALVSSAVVVFENRAPASGHEVAFSYGGTLLEPGKCENVLLDDLRRVNKWSSLPRSGDNGGAAKRAVLGDLFAVKRGLATGHNEFFILPRDEAARMGIPRSCVRPILPSPRFLKQEVIEADDDGWPILDRALALIDCNLSEEELHRRHPRLWQYLEEGKRRGVADGYLTTRRSPWYAQEKREPAPFLCTYMGRSPERPFRFLWNKSQATAANVYLLLYPRPEVAAILERQSDLLPQVFDALRSIAAREFFSEGRVYGGGLHKMEPAELMRLPADHIVDVLGLKLQEQHTLF